MKKHEKNITQKQLGKKIAGYGAMAASFLAMDAGLLAQSVCTSLSPAIISPNEDFSYDLDGDGNLDFRIDIDQNANSVAIGLNGNFVAYSGSYSYASIFGSTAQIDGSAYFAYSATVPFGVTGNLGVHVLLDCDGDGVLTNNSLVFAFVNITVANTGVITINSAGYDCSGGPITQAGVQSACMIPTIGQWSQMCLALFFMSTGVIYLNRKEEEFEVVAA